MTAEQWRKMKRSEAEVVSLQGAVLALVLALWGCVALADALLGGQTRPIDIRVLLWLRGPDDPGIPIGPSWLLIMARDVTALGGYPVAVLLTVMTAGYTLLARRYAASLLILAVSVGSMVLNTVLKLAFARARPEAVPHLIEVATLSFPSGHAMFAAAIYLTLAGVAAQTIDARRRAYIFGVALLLAGLVGLSRVYLGVHYPTDVLAGWAAGCAWALLCWLAMIALRTR